MGTRSEAGFPARSFDASGAYHADSTTATSSGDGTDEADPITGGHSVDSGRADSDCEHAGASDQHGSTYGDLVGTCCGRCDNVSAHLE